MFRSYADEEDRNERLLFTPSAQPQYGPPERPSNVIYELENEEERRPIGARVADFFGITSSAPGRVMREVGASIGSTLVASEAEGERMLSSLMTRYFTGSWPENWRESTYDEFFMNQYKQLMPDATEEELRPYVERAAQSGRILQYEPLDLLFGDGIDLIRAFKIAGGALAAIPVAEQVRKFGSRVFNRAVRRASRVSDVVDGIDVLGVSPGVVDEVPSAVTEAPGARLFEEPRPAPEAEDGFQKYLDEYYRDEELYTDPKYEGFETFANDPEMRMSPNELMETVRNIMRKPITEITNAEFDLLLGYEQRFREEVEYELGKLLNNGKPMDPDDLEEFTINYPGIDALTDEAIAIVDQRFTLTPEELAMREGLTDILGRARQQDIPFADEFEYPKIDFADQRLNLAPDDADTLTRLLNTPVRTIYAEGGEPVNPTDFPWLYSYLSGTFAHLQKWETQYIDDFIKSQGREPSTVELGLAVNEELERFTGLTRDQFTHLEELHKTSRDLFSLENELNKMLQADPEEILEDIESAEVMREFSERTARPRASDGDAPPDAVPFTDEEITEINRLINLSPVQTRIESEQQRLVEALNAMFNVQPAEVLARGNLLTEEYWPVIADAVEDIRDGTSTLPQELKDRVLDTAIRIASDPLNMMLNADPLPIIDRVVAEELRIEQLTAELNEMLNTPIADILVEMGAKRGEDVDDVADIVDEETRERVKQMMDWVDEYVAANPARPLRTGRTEFNSVQDFSVMYEQVYDDLLNFAEESQDGRLLEVANELDSLLSVMRGYGNAPFQEDPDNIRIVYDFLHGKLGSERATGLLNKLGISFRFGEDYTPQFDADKVNWNELYEAMNNEGFDGLDDF